MVGVITLGRSPVLPKLVWVWWAVETPRGATYMGSVTFVFVFMFFNRAIAHTRGPIFAHSSSKDAVWSKEDPFWDEKSVVVKFGGFYSKNIPKMGRNEPKYSQIKMSNNFETVKDTRKLSMNHNYETGVALSNSVNKTCVERPLVEKSRWRHTRLAIKPRKPCIPYKKLLWNAIRKSWSLFQNPSWKIALAPLVEVWRCPTCNKTLLSRKTIIAN